MTITGLVTRCVGNRCTVVGDDGNRYEAFVKGRLRLEGIRSTNPVVVGDRVRIRLPKDDASYKSTIEEPALIEAIEPRRNYIIRKAINLSKESHILAANIDLALLVITLEYPVTTTTFIDRFLATAEAYEVPVVLLFNKLDIYDAEYLHALEEFEALYQHIGYETLRTSATTGEGCDRLAALIRNKIVLLSGHSGVGKSTIINVLRPGSNLATAQLSQAHDTGMHTTTVGEMIALGDTLKKGFIIDTPGIKGFGTLEMDESNAAHFFREFFALSSKCRFHNCTHINEPDCAVLQALEEGRIAPSRYISYLSILEDSENGRYRAPQ